MQHNRKFYTSFLLIVFTLGYVSALVQDFSVVGETLFIVPTMVQQINVTAYGAQGGDGSYSSPGIGGQGGSVFATLSVTPGDTLYFRVGGRGATPAVNGQAAGGYNGGGPSTNECNCGTWYPGGGGGGASDVRYGNNTLAARVIVAGGGGGGTGRNGNKPGGGNGGGLVGQTGPGAKGGTGGSQTAGGTSTGGTFYNTSGSLGQGGKGQMYFSGDGGGGGGGYYGGSGGGVNKDVDLEGGGGGGGSSYTDPSKTSNVVHTQGGRNGDGFITITYFAVSTTSVSSSSSPSKVGDAVTFTATVVGWNVTGNVFFFTDKAVLLGNVSVTGSTAVFTTSSLTIGQHTVWASFQGDNLNLASTSSSIEQVVNPLPPTTTTTTTTTPAPSGGSTNSTTTSAPSTSSSTRGHNWFVALVSHLL